jgi:hypothetical protein
LTFPNLKAPPSLPEFDPKLFLNMPPRDRFITISTKLFMGLQVAIALTNKLEAFDPEAVGTD